MTSSLTHKLKPDSTCFNGISSIYRWNPIKIFMYLHLLVMLFPSICSFAVPHWCYFVGWDALSNWALDPGFSMLRPQFLIYWVRFAETCPLSWSGSIGIPWSHLHSCYPLVSSAIPSWYPLLFSLISRICAWLRIVWGGVYGIGGSNPFPLLLNTPQILKLGSMSKFGKFVVGQFETGNLLDFEIEKDSFSY